MSTVLHKKSILKKTLEVGKLTMVSRIFGIVRVFLLGRFLGSDVLSDAFFTAYKIPNSFRKIFAEGALSAAFIPTLVGIVRKDRSRANRLLSLSFILFEGVVLFLCGLVMWQASVIIAFIMPGFSADQVAITTPLLRILMPFLFFLSSSALLAGALQSVGHFFIPAFSPVLLNIIFISALLLSLHFGFAVETLCYFILLGGFLQFLLHLSAYIKFNFRFEGINKETWKDFNKVLVKFFPCLLSMSVMEVGLFIDTSFASYLHVGSVSLIHYANRFMGIPLGVFAVAFSTILLPHFSRVATYAPKRLSFYLLETTKFVLWVSLPVSIVMAFFSEKIFLTIFYSSKFPMSHVQEAGHILLAFLLGLFFFSLNKILLNMYYAMHVTIVPTVISIVGTILNVVINYLLIDSMHGVGLALATSISGMLQTLLFVAILKMKFGFVFYSKNFTSFVVHYVVQLSIIFSFFFVIYQLLEVTIKRMPFISVFLLFKMGFWLWAGPLAGLAFLVIFFSRKVFNIDLYFLD